MLSRKVNSGTDGGRRCYHSFMDLHRRIFCATIAFWSCIMQRIVLLQPSTVLHCKVMWICIISLSFLLQSLCGFATTVHFFCYEFSGDVSGKSLRRS